MFRLHLFGSPALFRKDEPVTIRRKRSRALLAYLAMQEIPQSRESLATLLWGETDQKTANANLRRELARLKSDIGEGLIFADRQTIGIDPQANLWLDAKAFSSRSTESSAAELSETIQLYTDDFMAGFTLPDCPQYDQWQYFQAEELRETFTAVLQSYMADQEENEDYDGAVATARRWLSLDTLHEPAHRSLMRYYALSGQLSAAIRQYHICARTLETELGIEPESETTALFEAIQNKQLSPTPAQIDLAIEPEQVVEKAPVRRHNLPQMADAFIGRQQEIKEIHTYLTQTDTRLLTLRGLGGIGKTRLAIQAGSQLIDSDHFPNGLFLVNLVGTENPDYLITTIADSLHVPLSAADDPLDQLINAIRTKEMLLLIDNFEHLQSGAAQLTTLLQHCPHLKMLVTSRQQLNLAGEHILLVEGLPLSDQPRRKSSAVQLFEERASQLAPQLDLNAERLFINAICRLVEGMPLAIEMCAAWIQTINCQEILAEIQSGLDLLEIDKADLPDRHKSIRAVFQSSFRLLTPAEREALLTLAVFRGSFSYTAAKQVANTSLIQLRALVEKSLLGVYGETAETRYHMHTLLRQFAMEQIAAEQLATAEINHTKYYASLLDKLSEKRCTTENHLIAAAVSTEGDNLRSVWHWLGRQTTAGNHTELICQAIDQLIPAWSHAYIYQTNFLEGKQLMNVVWQPMDTQHWKTGDTPQQWSYALITAMLGRFCMELSQFDEAEVFGQQALNIFRAQLDHHPHKARANIAGTLRTLARGDIRLTNYETAHDRLSEAIEIAPDHLTKGAPVYTFGILFSNTGQYDQALEHYQAGLQLFEQCHNRPGILKATSAIGSVYGRQRKYEEAIAHYEQVVKLARQLNLNVTVMVGLSNMAFCLNQIGRTSRVRDYYEEALALAEELGKQRWQAVIAQDFGLFLLEQGELQRAEPYVVNGLQLSKAIKAQADILSGLYPLAHLQAQKGRFEEAMVTLGFVLQDDISTDEIKGYAAEFWDELSSELPPIFTQRAQAKLENTTLDDILAMLSH